MPGILVLEDDPAVNSMISLTLSQAGYDVVSATSGVEALAAMQDPPDLMLLDLRLPDIDGSTFLAEALSKGFHGRVIIVSGSVEAPELARMIGADRLIMKPFEPEQLLAAVREVLADAARLQPRI